MLISIRKSFITILSLFIIAALFTGCTSSVTDEPTIETPPVEPEGFAIYLTRDTIPPDRMEMQSHVEIADSPVICEDDIVWYDAVTHEIQLTAKGFENVTGLGIGTGGKSFVVCIDRGPVYWGAFWTMISSQSFDGITIIQPFETQDPVIWIGKGYPADLNTKKDIRDNAVIMQRLKDAGKLINELPTTLIETLPSQMKGYELYSWQEDAEWYYRLIVGTNRNKTIEEIMSEDSSLVDLASIRVKGTEAILAVLGKLPGNEEVFWINRIDAGQPPFDYPDEVTVSILRNYADICGIELYVPEQITE